VFDGMKAQPCMHPELRLGLQRKRNGAEVVREWCEWCDWRSDEIARRKFSSEVLAVLPVAEDLTDNETTCGYRGCISPSTEDHHYAPRAMFGTEADNYPVGPLCVEHHNHWHQTITSGGAL